MAKNTVKTIGMTEDQKRVFFALDVNGYGGMPPSTGVKCFFSLEELYQAFKARIAAESAIVLFPEEPK